MLHADGPPDPPGPARIVGRYRMTGRVMGKGNYARVEEALHLDVNVHVAIKMINTQAVKDPYVLRNLHREANVLRTLKHPNIIAIFEALRAGSHHYCIVTELVTGGELCAYVGRQARHHLDEPTTLLFGAQLVSAVAYMHSLNVVHRDLKMKNIMLTRRCDQVKIVDFGLGRTWSTSKPLLTHCGSPGYAAPEIYLRDKPYGPEVDLWSLGVVLYFMAVGSLPFPPCRDPERSAPERRRRLVALISKGATEEHVKRMAHFSPDFRDLVQGLLTASVPRRLTLQQTVEHPWVSNRLRARNMLNIPYRLSSHERALILSKVAHTIRSTVQSVEAQTRQDALGEVAAMYNILAHKQLSAYHAAWTMRPARSAAGTQRRERAARRAGVAEDVQGPAGRWPMAEDVQGPAGRWPMAEDVQGPAGRWPMAEDVQGPPGRWPMAEDVQGPVGRWPMAEDVQGPAGRWPMAAPAPLPAPRQYLALPPAEPPSAPSPDRPPATASAHASPAAPTPPGLHSAKESTSVGVLASVTEPSIDVEALDDEPHAQGGAAESYELACLVRDEEGRTKLEAVPETKVMFFTETVLDNVHNALAASLTKSVCPIKSALVSQTGLANKTRKAVSFSIIADTGVQVNLVGSTETNAPPAPGLSEDDDPCKVEEANCTTQVSASPLFDQSQGTCTISKQDIALTEKLLKTAPVTRRVNPEPKKNIYEGRRWPLRSARTVYKQVKGHTKLSVSYLLDVQENLKNSTGNVDSRHVATTATNPLTLLPTHNDDDKQDKVDVTSVTIDRTEKQDTWSSGCPESFELICKTILNHPTSLNQEKTASERTVSSNYMENLRNAPDSKCEIPTHVGQLEKESKNNERAKDSSMGPFNTVAQFVKSKVKGYELETNKIKTAALNFTKR